MRRIYTIQSVRKKSLRRKPFIFLKNASDKSAKFVLQGLILLWSFHLTPSFSDTGGSKVPFSSNNLFARLQASAIFISRRRANIWRRILRSKSLSQQPQHGARTATLKFG